MKCVVTGGGGFLGRALCFRLLELGHEVWSISRRSYPELHQRGVRTIQADLSADAAALAQGFAGAGAVFHAAAKVDMWGPYAEFFRSNVAATQNVLRLCREHDVRRLIYTSSPSVIADGRSLRGVNEDYPYPGKHTAYYPATKAIAERMVLCANSAELWTLSLRPHLIWGPGDTNLVPAILSRARSGRLVRVGGGRNLTDIVYIDDCVEAHICALSALEAQPLCRGKAFFISQGEPVNMWEWISDILLRNGLPPPRRRLPAMAAMLLAACCEYCTALRRQNAEPLLTRFLVAQMSTDHYFDISRARELLGFVPKHTVREAMDLTFGAPGAQ